MLTRNHRTGLFAALFFLVLGVFPAWADEDRFRVSGFGTLGYAQSTSQDAQFVRDLYAPDGTTKRGSWNVDTVFGLQANWRLTDQFEAVVQGVSRYRYDRTYAPGISWAFLKWSPVSDVAIRVGRVGTDFFMLSDSRMVGYSYLTVRPPGDYFWHLPFYSIDGGDIAASLPLGEGVVRVKAFSGVSQEKIALAREVWDLDESRMNGALAEYLIGPWHLRASYSSITFRGEVPLRNLLLATPLPLSLVQQAESYLTVHNRRTDYYALGAVYDQGPWQAHLMLNKIDQGNRLFQDSISAYALLGYRIGAFTPYAGYSLARSKERDGAPNAVVNAFMMDSHVNQHTNTLGVRWDVQPDVAFKIQADQVRGTAASILPYRWENGQWNGRMNVYSATVDFIF